MHGSFFETEGRREDLIRQAGILAGLGVPVLNLSPDGSLPANVCSIVIRALDELSQELDRAGGPCNHGWTEQYLLTTEEVAFANTVPCDLLQNVERGEAWRQHIRDFLRDVAPCLSAPLQMGMTSWVNPTHSVDTLPGFYFLMLLWEPCLRLTLHLAGRTVLQRQLTGIGGVRHYRVQYRMMDDVGLLSADNISWLTRGLTATEKPVAERVLSLAVKCRNAVAHGAVFEYTEELRRVYGHLVIKAIQLVIDAGLQELQATGGH
jgi:hypothetical protein